MTQIYLADDESEPFIYLMESVNLNGCPLTNTDVTVEQYLQFAARDLEDASERGAVNALGNIKRALHQTVDTLLQGYGLLARNRRLSFPRKLELIDTAGLFSLSILKTLNNERNLVEHDYRVPTHARAKEALDVVRLWLLATRRLSEFVVYESLAGWRDDQTLGVVQLNPALGLLEFFKGNWSGAEACHSSSGPLVMRAWRMHAAGGEKSAAGLGGDRALVGGGEDGEFVEFWPPSVAGEPARGVVAEPAFP